MGDQEPNIVEYYFSFSNKLLSRVPTVPHDMKDFFGMSELFFFGSLENLIYISPDIG